MIIESELFSTSGELGGVISGLKEKAMSAYGVPVSLEGSCRFRAEALDLYSVNVGARVMRVSGSVEKMQGFISQHPGDFILTARV